MLLRSCKKQKSTQNAVYALFAWKLSIIVLLYRFDRVRMLITKVVALQCLRLQLLRVNTCLTWSIFHSIVHCLLKIFWRNWEDIILWLVTVQHSKPTMSWYDDPFRYSCYMNGENMNKDLQDEYFKRKVLERWELCITCALWILVQMNAMHFTEC